MFLPASFKFQSFNPVSFKGLLITPVVEEVQEGNRWAGEWLPLPVPKNLQPAPKPSRKVKVHGKSKDSRASVAIRCIPTARLSVSAQYRARSAAAVACTVDDTIVREEETILAALAALL